MKKVFKLVVIFTIAFAINSFAQNQPVDFKKAVLENVTFSGSTIGSAQGGQLYFPVQDYSGFKGIKFVLSDLKKLDGSANDSWMNLIIYYTDADGQDKKASMSFWMGGKKDVRFSNYKNGNEEIAIDPSKIKKIAIAIGAGKQFDINGVELSPKS